MKKQIKKKNENKISGISMGFSIASLIIAALPLGFVAFILAIIALAKDEEKGLKALILSIVLPLCSFIIALLFMGML